MCTHRTAGRWGKRWTAFSAAWLATFAVLEGYGLVTEGPEATYSHYLRRRAGLLERCRHSLAGRLTIVGICTWLGIHLGWGRLGFGGRRRCPHNP